MQKTIYECDGCKKVIGSEAHVTLVMSTNHPGTGVAVPPGHEVKGQLTDRWYTVKLPENFIHLHFKCMEKYFKDILDAKVGKPTPAKRHGKG